MLCFLQDRPHGTWTEPRTRFVVAFFSPVPDLLLMRKVRQTTWDGSSQFMKYPRRSAAKTAHTGVIRGIGGNRMRDQQGDSC